MTDPASPPEPEPDPLYLALMRERYGDVGALQRELIAHVPPPGEGTAPLAPRTPDGAGRYAEEHARVRRWARAKYPTAPIDLATIGAGGVAHVLVTRHDTIGEALCGRRGTALTASDTIPVCRVCTAS